MVSKQWGGRREGAGRKSEDGVADLIRVTVLLTGDTIDKATELGKGNVSLGLRKMLSNCSAPQAATKTNIPKKTDAKYKQRRIVEPYPGDYAPDGTKRSMPYVRGLRQKWREKYPDLNPDDY